MRSLILDLAVEDATGLWEIAWRSAEMRPRPTPDELIQLTVTMVQEGLLSVLCGTDVEQPVDDSQGVAEIRNPANWNPPQENGRQVRIVATEAGERAYYRQ